MFKGFPKHAFPKRGYPTGKIGNVGVLSDNDANNFCISAGITDLVERQAIYFLVTELKRQRLWNKCVAIYPMVGSSAVSCSFNLVNPNFHRITWVNSPTFSATGVQGNGSNQYGIINLQGTDSISALNCHLSFYGRNDVAGTRVAIGSLVGTTLLQINNSLTSTTAGLGSTTNIAVNSSIPSNTRLFIANRENANSLKFFRNGSLIASNTSLQAPYTNTINVFILARNNNGSPILFSNQECAFSSLGFGFTDQEILVFDGIVNQFQTMLSRNV